MTWPPTEEAAGRPIPIDGAPALRLHERAGFVATGVTGALPPRSEVREIELALELAGPDAAAPVQALDLSVLPGTLAVCRLPAGAGR